MEHLERFLFFVSGYFLCRTFHFFRLRDRLVRFYKIVAHGDEKHRKWLRDEFMAYWDVDLPVPKSQFEEHIWLKGCNYQADGACNKCGQVHNQTYEEAHGKEGPLGHHPDLK